MMQPMLSRQNLSPSISCVIPAYNEAPSLPRLITDILATLTPLSAQVEIIVVDDGSRDNTASVMQSVCQQHPQVMYLKLSRNFGKEPALTAGIEAAQGDVVAGQARGRGVVVGRLQVGLVGGTDLVDAGQNCQVG